MNKCTRTQANEGGEKQGAMRRAQLGAIRAGGVAMVTRGLALSPLEPPEAPFSAI